MPVSSSRHRFLVLAYFLLLFPGCSRTEVSPSFDKTSFATIRIGDSISEVYQAIGDPLFIQVNPDYVGDGCERQTRLNTASLKAAIHSGRDSRVELCLHYSQPSKLGAVYKRYEVRIRQGFVCEIVAGKDSE
jgi:hypothetical protein